jgi:hypothetical protein
LVKEAHMGYVFKNGVLIKTESEEKKPAGTPTGPEKPKAKETKKKEKSE